MKEVEVENFFSCVLADDEPTILSNLESSSIWRELGIRVIASHNNGEDVFNSIINLKPDFAVIDIKMPGLSGLEVLKKSSEAGARTKIIIISGYDEFQYAKEAIKWGACAYLLKPIDYTELSEELGFLISKANSQQTTVSSKSSANFFKDLIEGTIVDSSVIPRYLSSLNESISDTECYVVSILFTDKLSNADFPRLMPIMENTAGEARHKLWFQDAKKAVGIFNLSVETPFELANRIAENLEAEGYEGVRIGIGDIVPGLYQCSYSYNRALTALTYRIYGKERKVFTFMDICTVAPPADDPLSSVDISVAVLSDSDEELAKCVTAFMSSLLYVAMPSPNYIYSYCQAFADRTSSELSPLIPSSSNADIYKEIVESESLEDIVSALTAYLKKLSARISSIYGKEKAELVLAESHGLFEGDDELIRKAKRFIRENIQNKIQIPDVADAVNLSPSYFAIYFKNKTGQVLRDYLLSEKMEWASKALLDNKISVEEIALRLGYSDYHAFSRAFKKKYGQTPSAFSGKGKK